MFNAAYTIELPRILDRGRWGFHMKLGQRIRSHTACRSFVPRAASLSQVMLNRHWLLAGRARQFRVGRATREPFVHARDVEHMHAMEDANLVVALQVGEANGTFVVAPILTGDEKARSVSERHPRQDGIDGCHGRAARWRRSLFRAIGHTQ